MTDARRIHDVEQWIATSRAAAASFAGFYRTLIEEGVPQAEALAMTLAWITRPLPPPETPKGGA